MSPEILSPEAKGPELPLRSVPARPCCRGWRWVTLRHRCPTAAPLALPVAPLIPLLGVGRQAGKKEDGEKR